MIYRQCWGLWTKRKGRYFHQYEQRCKPPVQRGLDWLRWYSLGSLCTEVSLEESFAYTTEESEKMEVIQLAAELDGNYCLLPPTILFFILPEKPSFLPSLSWDWKNKRLVLQSYSQKFKSKGSLPQEKPLCQLCLLIPINNFICIPSVNSSKINNRGANLFPLL